MAIVVDCWCNYRDNEWTPFIIHRWSHQRWTNEWGPFISRRNENIFEETKNIMNGVHSIKIYTIQKTCLFCRRTQWICSAVADTEQSRTGWTIAVQVSYDMRSRTTPPPSLPDPTTRKLRLATYGMSGE